MPSPEKSIEQRLFEAFVNYRGMRLSAEDVSKLVHDDAIGTRISNQAAIEAGVDEGGADSVFLAAHGESWSSFCNRISRGEV